MNLGGWCPYYEAFLARNYAAIDIKEVSMAKIRAWLRTQRKEWFTNMVEYAVTHPNSRIPHMMAPAPSLLGWPSILVLLLIGDGALISICLVNPVAIFIFLVLCALFVIAYTALFAWVLRYR